MHAILHKGKTKYMDEINETEYIKMTSKVEKIPWIRMRKCRLDNGPNQDTLSCCCFDFDWFNKQKTKSKSFGLCFA